MTFNKKLKEVSANELLAHSLQTIPLNPMEQVPSATTHLELLLAYIKGCK